ncbi:amino acid adenylation domain-containing protein [Streptomyces sp. NPDC017520]|uniref:amino acid adenylation domain-containing protein n=1 Tax=Streptomyces sp. NPDC017520 TaxID=3364998 RepID=UPI00378FCF71
MTVSNDAAQQEGDVFFTLPFGGRCSGARACETVRRSRRIPKDISARLDPNIDKFAVAATIVLARKYGDGDAFRLGIRYHSTDVEIVSAMPSGLSLEAHRRTVSAALDGLASAPEVSPDPTFSYLLGPADGQNLAGLTISHEATPLGVVVHADFDEHVHSAEFVQRLLGHLENILRQSVDQPLLTIGDVELLSEPERARWAVLNDTARPYPRDASIFEMFAAWAAAHPDQVAVLHDGEETTYGELNELSRRLAVRLGEYGIGRHSRVALQLAKSPRLIVALLAVLRLGAAYVPIGPEVPDARRDFLLEDSGAALLVVDGTAGPARIPVLDLAVPVQPPVGVKPPEVAVSATDAAYIMYTSGTTGGPKGAVVCQRAVVRLVCGTDFVELSPTTRILQTGAISFDATTFEFWGALLNGGSLVLVPGETVLNAGELGAAIARYEVNTLWVTAGLFEQLIEQDPAVFNGCRVIFGGDVASPGHLAAAVRACPDSEFLNGYGPTENTTFSAVHRVTRTHVDRIPIGRPIANSTAWVLDRDGRPRPVGVPGELYVGGDGLSDGYLNHAELTKASFVEVAGVSGRLYRTGDIVVLNEELELEFLGRTDGQVKVRGYRVELPEIEHWLSRVPGVRQAVVLTRKQAGGAESLLVFLTAGVPVDLSDILTELRRELPEYMVPAFIEQVDAMPLTVNHKVDRKALAARWEANRQLLEEPPAEEYRLEPLTSMESKVAEILSSVLKVQVRTADADFLALGGDSLRVMRVQNRVRKELGLEIRIRQILENSTVREIASILDQAGPGATARPSLGRRS